MFTLMIGKTLSNLWHTAITVNLIFKQFLSTSPITLRSLRRTQKTTPSRLICELRDLHINGLGTVYIITLLNFISRGQYPIYDRFAWKAIQAICDDKKPGDIINASELPEKKSRAFDTVFDTHMISYMKKMDSVFGSAYQESRDVDRALWVYGHAF